MPGPDLSRPPAQKPHLDLEKTKKNTQKYAFYRRGAQRNNSNLYMMNFFQSRRVACAAPTKGCLRRPNQRVACAGPTKRCLALPQPKGGLRSQNLKKIAGNTWKLLEIDENK